MNRAEYQKLRAETWAQTWAAVAGCDSCKSKEVATAWADECLKEFDRRFPENLLVVETRLEIRRPTKIKASDLKFIR